MTPKRGRPPGTDYANACRLLGLWQYRPETKKYSYEALAAELGCSARSIYRYFKLLAQTNGLQYKNKVVVHNGKWSKIRTSLDFNTKLDYRSTYLSRNN